MLKSSLTIDDSTRPKYYYFEDIDRTMYYSPKEKENVFQKKYKFRKPGQLKLLINEIRFLTQDVKIQNYANDLFDILYIGSGKGFHIPYLIRMYSHYNINWYFFDPNGHCEELNNMAEKSKKDRKENKIFIYDTYFEESAFNLFRNNNRNLLFISDIRTADTDKEPATINLLFDYELQRKTIEALTPMFSLLKFRMPFPDDWKEEYENKLIFPTGKNYLQAFLPNDSAEFRIFINSTAGFKAVNIETLREFESKFMWYNSVERRNITNDLEIAGYVIDTYNKIENKTKRVDLHSEMKERDKIIEWKKIISIFNDS